MVVTTWKKHPKRSKRRQSLRSDISLIVQLPSVPHGPTLTIFVQSVDTLVDTLSSLRDTLDFYQYKKYTSKDYNSYNHKKYTRQLRLERVNCARSA